MKLNNMEVIQAQGALGKLGELDLPIKVSLDIALISNMVDVQVKAYQTVLQGIYKKYSIKTEPLETGGVQFNSTADGETEEATVKLRQGNLEAFSGKLNDLLEANTQDMSFKKIQLPSNITIKPEILKSLTEFVEVA